MTAKNHLYATVAASLFLFLVVPLLESITVKAVSIVTLSFFSVSAGGLSAETFEIATNRSATARSQRNAKGYFMSVVCSLLFFAIVTPSITLAIDSNGAVNIASASALLALSLGIGGLVTDGFFALFTKLPVLPAVNPSTKEIGKIQLPHATSPENGVVDVLLGKAKLGGE